MEHVAVKSVDELKANFGDKATVVDFFATWCAPCKHLAPQLDTLVKEAGSGVKGLKIDVEESVDVAESFQINAMPTVMIFKGKESNPECTIVGNRIDAVKEGLNKILKDV